MADRHIWICFLWHMHQPFYKDLVSGEYKLPWTRMHALKDYYGMVKILDEFPDIRQTFNLVPSMVVQLEEYASGEAADPFFRLAAKPAEDLTAQEQESILQYFFQANAARMIYRYPRYGELFDLWQASGRNFSRAKRSFDPRALRDLQVLSQLAWFDEEYQQHDGLVRALVRKGRDFTVEDQRQLSRKQTEVIGNVMPAYCDFAARGRIEISTTPFYHPILPLICDSSIAEVAHPYVPLPSRFRHPEDAREHLTRSRSFMRERLDTSPPASGRRKARSATRPSALRRSAGSAGSRATTAFSGAR
jgi:alpha-amylase/alpha-mannosidase (GH57 family)